MGIAIGDFDALVTHPVRNGYSGKAHINQQADVTVPQIVDSDALDSGGLGASVHLVMEIAFGHGENAVLLFQPVEHSKIVLHSVLPQFAGNDTKILGAGGRLPGKDR